MQAPDIDVVAKLQHRLAMYPHVVDKHAVAAVVPQGKPAAGGPDAGVAAGDIFRAAVLEGIADPAFRRGPDQDLLRLQGVFGVSRKAAAAVPRHDGEDIPPPLPV